MRKGSVSAGGRTSAAMPPVEAEWAGRHGPQYVPGRRELEALFGPGLPTDRPPRLLGFFAHPDDEVFCVGGTIARCAVDGAITGLVSLTQGEAGEIRDAEVASRRTLGTVRVKELEASASVLGVDHVACLDHGDGTLTAQDLGALADVATEMIEAFAPDVVVTFGPDGGFGHPDHIVSSDAVLQAVRRMDTPPRLLHAKFPMQGHLMVEAIVEWLHAQHLRFRGGIEFAHALKLFADGASMLGMASDHVRVEWFPPGAYIIEQDEPANDLFCILSGTADIVAELDNGRMHPLHIARVGSFVGEDALLSGTTRNAHVIARDAVTCLVLSPQARNLSAGRGGSAAAAGPRDIPQAPAEDCVVVDVRSTLERKVAALAAHRSQYALAPDLLPMSMLDRLLGTERFVVVDPVHA